MLTKFTAVGSDGEACWVNPDKVLVVYASRPGVTTIRLTHEIYVNVSESVETVANEVNKCS